MLKTPYAKPRVEQAGDTENGCRQNTYEYIYIAFIRGNLMKLIQYTLLLSFALFPCLVQAAFFGDECPAISTSCGAGATFETAFAPDDKLMELVIKSVKSAKKSVKVIAHRFVSKDLSIALIGVARSNRDVKILLDRKDDNNGYSAGLFFVNMTNPPRMVENYEHQYQEYILVDDTDLIIGNISSIPDENEEAKSSAGVLIIHNAGDLAKKYAENWDKLWKNSEEMKNHNLITTKPKK